MTLRAPILALCWLLPLIMTAPGSQTGTRQLLQNKCDQCNFCACNDNCDCIDDLSKCDQCNFCECDVNCDCIGPSKCDQCNSCDCNENCDCIDDKAETRTEAPASPSPSLPPSNAPLNEQSNVVLIIIIVAAAIGGSVLMLVAVLVIRWRSGRKRARELQRPIMLADLLVTSNNPLATRYMSEFMNFKDVKGKGLQGDKTSGDRLPSDSDAVLSMNFHGGGNGPPMGTSFYYGDVAPSSSISHENSSNASGSAPRSNKWSGSPNIAAHNTASNDAPALASTAPQQAQMIDAAKVQMCREENGELCLLGRGASAVVYKGAYQGEFVAIKMMSLLPDARGRPGILVDRMMREINVLCRLNGQEGILRLLGFATGDVAWMLVTDYMPGGSLADVLHTRGQAVQKRFLWRNGGAKVMLAVARGLANLHFLKVIHLDLKPHNILLDAEDRPCIADMGLAKIQAKTLETAHGGTLAYTPPEQLGGHVTDRADVYSFGVMLWEVVTGERPPLSHDQRRKPRVPEECGEGVVQLLDSCLAIDASARPCAQQLVERLAVLVDEMGEGRRRVSAAEAPLHGSHSGKGPQWMGPANTSDGNGPPMGTSYYGGSPLPADRCCFPPFHQGAQLLTSGS